MNEFHHEPGNTVDANFRVANLVGVMISIALPVLAILLICFRTKFTVLVGIGAIPIGIFASLLGFCCVLVLASRYVWHRNAAHYLDSRNSIVAACRVAHISASLVIGLPCLVISALLLRIRPESLSISILLLAIAPTAYFFLPGKNQWHSLFNARNQA